LINCNPTPVDFKKSEINMEYLKLYRLSFSIELCRIVSSVLLALHQSLGQFQISLRQLKLLPSDQLNALFSAITFAAGC